MQEAAEGTPQQAKLCFAHAETIIPLACLLGLFGPQQPKALLTQPTSAPQCSADSIMQQPAAGTLNTDQQPDHGTVNSLCNDCFGSQEICPYIELSLFRETTAVRMQSLVTNGVVLTLSLSLY